MELKYIKDIESSINLENRDFYYHFFNFNRDDVINILTEGLKCPLLRGKIYPGFNGPFYVSLSKEMPEYKNDKNSIYYLTYDRPMFIIEGIKPVKCDPERYFGLMNSPLPFRPTQYIDEYQKFWKVNPDNIVAIKYNIYDYNYKLSYLLELREMIYILDRLDKEIPVYDYSRTLEEKKEIDKEKFLYYMRK